MRSHHVAGPVLAALALACAAGCGERAGSPEVQAPAVATAPVVAQDLEERIGATGELEAQLRTTLAAEVSGRVTHLVAEEGDAVVVGSTLVEIDPERRALALEEARARSTQAQARLAKERRETQRVRTLHESRVASQSQLDGAETALALAVADATVARAQLGVAERAVSDATVLAPFAGLLSRRHVNVGEFVQPGALLFDLVSLDPIDVVFSLAEVDSSRVAVGQRVEVRVAPWPDRVFEARVAVVSPTIDTATRTLRVKATLPNPDGLLRPGLFARADLGVALRRGVALVPAEAVLQRASGPVVFVVRDGNVAERREIELGPFHRNAVEVRSGLAAGEIVVTRGHASLVDGAVVRVAETAAPPGAVVPTASGVASAARPDGSS